MLCKGNNLLDAHISAAKTAAVCKADQQTGIQREPTRDPPPLECFLPAVSYHWSQTLSQPTPALGPAPPPLSRAGTNCLPQSKSLKPHQSDSDTAAARDVLLSELQRENQFSQSVKRDRSREGPAWKMLVIFPQDFKPLKMYWEGKLTA